jgi:hypothetical protein
MAKRLSVKRRKYRRDTATAERAGTRPAKHKVAVERSKKAKAKNAYRAT